MAEHAEDPSSEPLYVLRHSAAHVLAAAVRQLYPEAKYAIGPPVENGFYYDFELPEPISEKDLPRIEKKMAEIIRRRESFEQQKLPRAEAVERFRELGQTYKLEILESEAKADQVISTYRTGEFFDLCRGPHIADSGDIRAFKLMRLAGAYWRGDQDNKMLTRIYGTAWPSREQLEQYLRDLAEAEKRDHKKLGRELKLFAFDERAGAGLPLWLPAGATVRREIERWIVDEEVDRGYQHVRTPDVARLDLYKQSGHWERYHDSMYPPMRFEDSGEVLELRPMNCPHHILVYQTEMRSYRDLPLRIAEIGNNWRFEKSGELSGMNRVRAFALNDAHIFCTPEQLEAEVREALSLAMHFSQVLGVDEYWFRLSVRDEAKEKWIGGSEQWEAAQAALAGALESLDQVYRLGPGEAAFYGPKIDFQVRDAMHREFTNSTVQVDFQLPELFQLEYVSEDGGRSRPVMVHRGAAGAMERLFAYLIERYAGAFPTWLAPTQVAVIPITDAHLDYARQVSERLRRSRIRVELEGSPERMGKKIREAQRRKIPYMAIVGDREAEAREVSVRDRAGEQTSEPLEDFAQRVAVEIAERRR